MPETAVPALDFSADADLISFLKAIPDGRYRRGVRYPQWYLLLITVLGILSNCRSSRDLEAFAKRHREALNQALGLNFKRWPRMRRSSICSTRPISSSSARCCRPG
jgi:hypothetical protein